MISEKNIEHCLTQIQKKIQSPKNYGEVQAANEIIELYNNEFEKYDWGNEREKAVRKELHALKSATTQIATYHQTNHWGQVICSQIGWFLTWLNKNHKTKSV